MSRRQPLRRLLPYYRPYRAKMVLGLSLTVLSYAFSTAGPWFLQKAVDDFVNKAPMSRIWLLVAAMIGVALVGGFFRFMMRQTINKVSRWIEYDLRNDLFAKLETLDAAYFARNRTGDLMARLTNDLSAVRMAAGPAVMYLTNTIAGGTFALLFMLNIDKRLTLIALLPMALLPVSMIWLGRAIHHRFEDVQDHFGRMTTMAQENISGVRVVRAYRQEAPETARFAALGQEYLTKQMRLALLYGMMHPTFQMLAGLGSVVVLGLGGALAIRGTITVGAFVAFGLYLGMLTWPLIALGFVTNLFQRGAASMGRLLDILDAHPAIAIPEHAGALPRVAAGRTIEFRDVGFHYPTAEGHEPRWVLRHVSFTAPAGATVGVVGATGSGKSALLDLVPRFFDPQEGEILIDGTPLRALDLDAWRREIGYVQQESFLFSDSIGHNLDYGAADDSSREWAASVAQLTTTVDALPERYDTMLGERGINLSGGQKQRAALARALARKPSVVLLDDALSAVDTHTEAEILKALRTTLAGRTALIASHRVSAIRDATFTVVLDEGRVVEQGTHDALLAAGGRYWSLLNRQQLEESLEAPIASA
ncbi:MAG TPA: ABC transporter ATP-binding protein [Gemmatimonadaceae bacterium]|nr:ABC transporter ATP-binding protein [Gemmatimonadaceae bacterium]